MRDPSWMEPSAQHVETPSVSGNRVGAAVAPAESADDDPPYLGAWRAYKKRWREVWLIGFLGFLMLGGLALWMESTGRTEGILAALWPMWGMAWFATTGIAAARIIGFSCPRCGNGFFTLGKPMTSQLKCPHCGLRKFQVDDSGRSLWQLKRPKR